MEFLLNYPEFVYGLSVCMCTFVILKYLIPKPTRNQKFLVLLLSGVILGVITWFTTECKLHLIILAFFASTGFYELIIKLVMRKFNTSYQNE